MTRLTVAQLAQRLQARLSGEVDGGNGIIAAVGPVEAAGENEVTFVANKKHVTALRNSRAGAVIVSEPVEGLGKPQLIVENVEKALIEALGIFAPQLKPRAAGIDPTARVSEGVKTGRDVYIGAGAVVEEGAEIGAGSIISAGCRIGQNSRLGDNCRLDNNVVIYHNCTLGNNVIIQANSTIGSTGFGYYFIDGAHKLVPHNGTVVIEDFVEIGANCCIDRAKFGQTRVGAGTKIDNLVQIAHNVIIGKCCLIAAQVGLAGSCRLGDGVVMGGQAGVADNITIGDGTMVGGQAGVCLRDPGKGEKLFGTPAIDIKEEFRLVGLRRRLPEVFKRLKQLSSRIEKLEAAKDDKKSG